MSKFLEVDEIARLGSINRRWNYICDNEEIWEWQFENKWKEKFNSYQLVDSESYKKNCAATFERNKYDEEHSELSQQKRDELCGYYLLIFDEFLQSAMEFPQLIVAPLKIISFLFQNHYQLQPILTVQGNQFLNYQYSTFSRLKQEAYNAINDPQTQITWQNQHLYLFLQFFYFVSPWVYNLIYYMTLIPYYIIKKTSAGKSIRIIIEHINEDQNVNFYNEIPMNLEVPLEQNQIKRTLLILLQIPTCIFIFCFYLYNFIGHQIFLLIFSEFRWYTCLLLPGVITFSVPYSLITLYEIRRSFPHFDPRLGYYITVDYMRKKKKSIKEIIQKNWKSFKDKISKLYEKLKLYYSQRSGKFYKQLKVKFQKAKDFVYNKIIKPIKQYITKLWEKSWKITNDAYEIIRKLLLKIQGYLSYCKSQSIKFYAYIVAKFIYPAYNSFVSLLFKIYENLIKPLYDYFVVTFKFIWELFTKLLSAIKKILDVLSSFYHKIISAIKFIYDNILNFFKQLKYFYKYVISQATLISFKYGYLGDLILTIFGILWMTWPLILAFVFDMPFAMKFISGIITGRLVFIGYNEIKSVTAQQG